MAVITSTSCQTNHTNKTEILSPENAKTLAHLPLELIFRIFSYILDPRKSASSVQFYWAVRGVCQLRSEVIEEKEQKKSFEEELKNDFFRQPIFTKYIPQKLPDEFFKDTSKLQFRLFYLFQAYLGMEIPFPLESMNDKLRFNEDYENIAFKNDHSLSFSYMLKLNGIILKRLQDYLFHKAAFRGDLEKLDSLPKDLSALSINGFEGMTPLHLAAANGQTEAVQKLLQFDPSLLAFVQNKQGKTALHEASIRGHLAVVQVLLKHGPSLTSIQDNSGYTALHDAAFSSKNSAVIKLLLQTNPCLGSIKDRHMGETPLFKAALHLESDVVKVFLEHDSSLASIRNRYGRIVLHEAARYGRLEVVTALLQSDSSLAFIQDMYGETALHKAVEYGKVEVVKILLQTAPSLVSVRTRRGLTVFHLIDPSSASIQKRDKGMSIFDMINPQTIESLRFEISKFKHFNK